MSANCSMPSNVPVLLSRGSKIEFLEAPRTLHAAAGASCGRSVEASSTEQ